MKPNSLAALSITGSTAIAFLFAACATVDPPRRQTVAVTSSNIRTTPLLNPGGKYIIQPGDLLTITFAGEPDYNQQVRVDWNGRVALPWLAASGERTEINAAGMSASSLASRISELASNNSILVEPRAQVFVSDYAGSTFTVLGQVNHPGRYSFPRGVPPRMGIEEAIGMGGGFTRLARESYVVVKRGGTVQRVNLRKMITQPEGGEFVIQPGDVITVGERVF